MTERPPEASPVPAGPRSRRRRWLSWALGILLGIVALIVAAVLALQHPPIATRFVNGALARLPALARAQMKVTQVRGTWVTGLEITGFRLARGETLLVAIDTVRVRYRPASLLTGHLDAQSLELSGFLVTADLIDTTVRTPAPRTRAPLTFADVLRGRFYRGPAFAIDRLAIRRGRYGDRLGTPDSSAIATEIELRAHGIRLGRDFAFTVDSLHARRARTGARIDLALAASMERGRLQTSMLRFSSDASAIDAEVLFGLDAADSLSEAHIVLRPGARFALADLRAFFPDLALEGTVSGAIDLRGPRRDRVSGTVDLTADRARWGDLSLDAFHLQATVTDGAADTRLSARWEGANLDASGSMRPFDASPSYDLDVRAARLPARIPGVTWWPALAARAGAGATLHVKGTGYERPIGSITGRIAGEVGTIDFDARADLPHDLAWEVRRLTFTDLDLARLIGDTLASSVNGTLTASGATPASGPRRLAATLALSPSDYGIRHVDQAHARVSMAGENLGGSLRLATSGGTVEIDSIVGRWDRNGALELRGARFSRLDLARLSGTPALASELQGTVRGRMRGVTALAGAGGGSAALRDGRTRGDLNVALAPSRFRGQAIDRASIALQLNQGQVKLSGVIDTPSGHVALDVLARPFDAQPSWQLERGRFTNVDLAAWTGSAGLRSRLSGHLAGRGRIPRTGLDPSGEAELIFDPSRIANLDLTGGSVHGTWSRDRANLVAGLHGTADTVNARLQILPGRDQPSGNAEVDVPLRLIAAIAGRESLITRGRVTGRASFMGLAPATARADGEVRGSGVLGATRLDSLFAGFQLRSGVLMLDTLLAQSNVGAVAGGGRIALFDSTAGSDLRARVRVIDARPLRDLLGADTVQVDTSTLAIRVQGAGGKRTVRVEGTLRSLVYNGVRLQGAEGSVDGELDAGWRPGRTRVDASLRRLRGIGIPVNEARGRLDVDRGVASFDVTGNRDERHRMHAVGRSVTDSAGRHVTLETVDLVADTVNWALARPARIDLGRDRFAVHDFTLESRGGRLDARGVIDRRGEQDFRLSLKEVGLDILSVLLGRENLSGTLNGDVRLEGPARTPRGNADLRMAIRVDGQPAGIVSTTSRWNGEQLDFRGRFATPEGDSIAWTGNLPLAISLAVTDSNSRVRVLEGDVDVRLLARQFPLGALSPLLDPRTVGRLDGTLDLDARLRGSSRAVTGTGRIDVAGGVLPLPGLGVVYRELEFHGAFENDRLVVNRAHATSNKGALDASGDVRFVGVSRIEPRLKVDMRKFTFTETQDLRAIASGSLEVSGTVTSPVVKGKATIENSEFYLVQSDLQDPASSVRLTDADLRMLEEQFGELTATPPNAAMAMYDASTLDLAVTLERNNWVRQRVRPRMSVALTGDFQLRKEPDGEPQLFGKIAPIPGRGYVEQFARSFDITGGEVLLNGPMKSHRVDITAQYKPPSRSDSDEDETVVKLDVEGTIDKLSLVLSSEPAMSEVEIIDFIATGRTKTDPSSSASDANLAKDIGLSTVSGFAEERAQEAIGLDVLQVRFDALQGATLVAGRYIDPQLYVGFRQPLQYKDTGASSNSDVTTSTSVELEYAIHKWLVVNLQGETSKVRSFFRVRHAY